MTDEAPSRTNQADLDEIQKILSVLPDEQSRQGVLEALLVNRCRKCIDDNPRGGPFWCCYDSRGG